MQFPFTSADSIIFSSPGPKKTAYVVNDGLWFRIVSQNQSEFICVSPDTIRTPFSEVIQMNVKMKDPLKSTLLIVGLAGAVTVIAGLIAATTMSFAMSGFGI